MSIYYLAAQSQSARASLPASLRSRVVVVGGGFAGLYCAIGLAERGTHEVVLVERERIGFGASGRNGGFVFAGYSLGEGSLWERFGARLAPTLYARTVQAVNQIRARILEHRFDCELSDHGVVWANWFKQDEVLRARQRLLADCYQSDWQWLDAQQLNRYVRSDRYSGGLFEANAMHLHPLKYAQALAAYAETLGVKIFEHTPATALSQIGKRWKLECGKHAVEAEQVVLCMGGYASALAPKLKRAMLPIATYVMCTEPLGSTLEQLIPGQAAIYDTRFAFDYYRKLADQRLLWGGRISILERSPASVAKLLKADMLKVFPSLKDAKIEYAWSGLMSYARHEMPQLGLLEPGLWYAQSFGGHGLAPTQVAGEILASAIAEGSQDYREFAAMPLSRVYGWAGKLAAQARYSYLQFKDRQADR
jgi:gamma-glutamylputrescine oxidase